MTTIAPVKQSGIADRQRVQKKPIARVFPRAHYLDGKQKGRPRGRPFYKPLIERSGEAGAGLLLATPAQGSPGHTPVRATGFLAAGKKSPHPVPSATAAAVTLPRYDRTAHSITSASISAQGRTCPSGPTTATIRSWK